MNSTRPDLDRVFSGYIQAMLWVNTIDHEDETEPIDAREFDVTVDLLTHATEDVHDFVTGNLELLDGLDPEQIGHDLALTRNRHGAGFWDRGLGRRGEELTELAHALGEETWITNDNGKVELLG